MIRPGTLKLILLFTSLAMPLQSQAQEPLVLTEAQARQEAELAISHIKNSHPDPYWKTDQAIWDAYERKLLARKGPVPIGQHYFDLAYLFSLATDTHTQIYPDIKTPGFYKVYPIRFRTFTDGLYVLAAAPAYESYIGKKILSIGGIPAGELMQKLAHFVSADHMGRKRTLAEFLLIMPETYQYLGLMQGGGVSLELEDATGKRVKASLSTTEEKPFAQVFYGEPDSFGILVPDGWKTIYDAFGITPSMSRRHLRKKYWHTSFKQEGGELVEYLQINKNEDEAEGEKLYDFLLRTFQDIRKKDTLVSRIIVDLRYNLGGWISKTAALPGLLYGAGFHKPGNTVVLIGRESVSAGAILAGSIEMQNYSCFIGEPSGSKPNMFLDHKPVDLPYSRFYAESATERYTTTVEADKREYLAPDIEIRESFADFISGQDRALDKALQLTAEEVKSFQGGLFRGDLWKRPSQNGAVAEK